MQHCVNEFVKEHGQVRVCLGTPVHQEQNDWHDMTEILIKRDIANHCHPQTRTEQKSVVITN
jgi:hypothetical protein